MLTLDNFRGVDFSSSPLNVSSNRAASMRNFILVDGRTKKRNGWKEVISAPTILGFCNYKHVTNQGVKECVIVVDEYGIWSYDATDVSYNNSKYLRDFLGQKISSATFVFNQGFLYIFACNLYIYGTWDDGVTYEVRDLTQIDPYIPTTTISIDAEGGKVGSLEEPNLLTNKRKNKLTGLPLAKYTEISASEINWEYFVWELDTPISLHTRVFVDMELIDSGNGEVIELKLCTGFYNTRNLYECDALLNSYGVKDFSEIAGVYYQKPDAENTIKTYAQISSSGKSLCFYIATPPPIEGKDNITVTFEAAQYDFENRAKITNCDMGTLFGAEGANDRLFLSGNPDYPNMVYFSGINDFTYWPDTNYLVAGSEASPVNGFQRLADNTLAIYKAGGDYEPTIYYAWGDLVTKTDDDTGAEITDEVFYIKSGAVGEGCVSARACAYFAGDNIMLSKNGVFGIVLTDNVSTNERYARERSRLINSKLCQADLSKASAIVYKGKYYLALNDEVGSCFVANARYKTSVDDDIDGSYNYEWWYWDNVPARTWAIIDDQLWFGTDDGRICVFDDEYADRTYITTSDGEIAFNGDHVTASSILASNIEKANSVTFNADVYALIHTADKLDGGRIVLDTYKTTADEKCAEIKLYDIFNLHEGMKVYVDTVGSSGLSVDTAYTVTDVDYGSCSYKLTLNGADVVPASTGFKVYQKIPAKTPLYIYDTDNTDLKFWLKATEDGDPLDLCAYNSTASSTSVSATFEYRSPVVAEWYTPVLDFGTNEQSKTLLKITVCAEATPGGKLSLGYDTRYANSHEIKGINTFSLNRISLQNFSFDVGFANSYSQKVYERNFNFLQFNFISDNDKNCIINSLSAIYKINKANRGVR